MASRSGAAGLDDAMLHPLLGYLLAQAEVSARRVYRQHLGEPLALRPVEFTLLMLLLANGSATPTQLATTLQLPPPNVTVLADRLVQRGLLQRQRSAADGRGLDLLLTAKGSTLARRAQRVSAGMESGLLAPLSPAERAMLSELLLKLVRGAAASAG
jgi:DNA-binding MarR family transcriptional regulator